MIKSLRKLRRWPLIAAIAVAAAVPVALSASSGAAASSAPAAHPVIDTNFLYHELYYPATHFITRVAGADGPPSIRRTSTTCRRTTTGRRSSTRGGSRR